MDRQFVSALARGLQVLASFTPANPDLSASEIARITGLPQPTVWRLCYTLLQLGYLTTNPGGQTMRPGISLLGLGQAVLAAEPISGIALPRMQQLAARYQGAVSLGARDGLNMIYLQRCQGSSIILANLHIGSKVSMATSATGWAYLAGLASEERELVFAELKVHLGDEWPPLEQRIRAAIDDYQRSGYVINLGSLHEHINAVAVPIVSQDGSHVLALSSGGISQIFDLPTLAEIGSELKDLAAKLVPLLERSSTPLE
jgi:DNA-binding IclR family transcriptional regulator